MKERGMIFNAEMVRAILDGRKTQTRRILKSDCMDIVEKDDDTLWPWREHDNGGDYWYPCPFGEVGDRIWVRETFASGLSTKSTLAYRATHKRQDLEDGFYETIKWTPSIHMPRWASRITLEITGVRVERLKDISEADARREGLFRELYDWRESEWPLDDVAYKTSQSAKTRYSCPKQCFLNLWESIYGEESWQANPWVWVVEFKRIEGGAA